MGIKLTNTNKIKLFIRCIIFALVSAIVSTPLQLFNSIVIEGIQGPPPFVTVPFLCYALFMKVLFAIGYLLIGYKLPIKNTILRGFTYIMFVYCGNYIPQVLGMLGGDGTIIQSAFSPSIFICDAISFMIDGVVLGLIMKKYHTDYIKSKYPKKQIILASILCGISFPFLVFILELVTGKINSNYYSHIAMGVSNKRATQFYIVFYGFIAIAGILLPIFYRLTNHIKTNLQSALLWGLFYAVFIWNPVVVIMIFFGSMLNATFVFAIIFTVAIVFTCLLNWYTIWIYNYRK